MRLSSARPPFAPARRRAHRSPALARRIAGRVRALFSLLSWLARLLGGRGWVSRVCLPVLRWLWRVLWWVSVALARLRWRSLRASGRWVGLSRRGRCVRLWLWVVGWVLWWLFWVAVVPVVLAGDVGGTCGGNVGRAKAANPEGSTANMNPKKATLTKAKCRATLTSQSKKVNKKNRKNEKN